MTDATARQAIRIPFVRAFAFGRAFAVLGGQMVSLAVGWMLYDRTGSPWALGLVGAVLIAPMLVLFIPAGHAVDRYPRRHLASLGHGLQALSSLGLAWVAWRGAPTPWVYGFLTLTGVARAISAPSVGTILPQLLAPVEFANANAWISATFELSSIAGPAVGGLLIAATGTPTLAFLVAAAGQVVFLVALTRVPLVPPPPRSASEGGGGLLAGFSFVRGTPVFLAAMTLDLFAVLLGGAVALLPIFAKDVLHVGPAGLGWLRAAPSLGAFSMAIAATRRRPWMRPGRALLLAVTGFGLATIGFGLSRSFALSLVCLFLTGVFDSVSVVIRMTLEQMVTPDRLRGRVSSVNFVFIGLSNEMGAFESGATAALVGPILSVVGGGIGTLLVVGLVVWRWPELARVGPLSTLRPAGEGSKAPLEDA